MEKLDVSCPIPTNIHKTWPYYEYYLGETDQERRRNGHGQNHWSGAESLEWYTGRFVRDMMHGEGEYRCRYHGPEGAFVSYEGQFYGNRMHGYGAMSYPDGRVFNGLFYHNMRWGPGIESHANLQENVGLWRGKQLVRLTWQPNTPSVALDLSSCAAAFVEPFRILLTTRVQIIGEVNNAIDMLKQNGVDPITASENWTKLYPEHCTDLASQLCHIELFDHAYYKNKIVELEDVDTKPETKEDASLTNKDSYPDSETYFAWNNNGMMVNMMKHCFKHETQRNRSGIDLRTLLTGPRSQYKSAAKHEVDCRTLLMASYLGHIKSVAKLINEENVHPDVADILGNTALMYATCGNRGDIVHFLVEAGANVNSFNDSCCTPLGVALIKFACGSKDIAASDCVQALLPPPSTANVIPILPTSLDVKASEWHITRDLPVQIIDVQLNGTTKQTIVVKNNGSRKASNLTSSININPKDRTKSFTVVTPKVTEMAKDEDNKMYSEERRHSININTEFLKTVRDLFSITSVPKPVPFLFEVTDMVKEVERNMEESKAPPNGKSKTQIQKNIKDPTKPSSTMTRQNSEKDVISVNSTGRAKIEMLSQNMSTIMQLLSDGADPRLVRCPQPALWIAVASGSPDLVRHLVTHGADINEVYPKILNYTILDVAVCRPLTQENLTLTQAILECGGRTDHKLKYPATSDCSLHEELGPTLLHAVLAKSIMDDTEEEIRRQLLELLLMHNCSALAQFKGCSALDMAMMMNMDLFDIFIRCPKTDLNAIINECNQTVLVKMFSLQFYKSITITERLQTITNLLLYGADPLEECQDGDVKFANIFVYAKKTLSYLELCNPGGEKADVKGKKGNENVKKEPIEKPTKSGSDDLGDYQQAFNLVKDCARILHVRWLQAKLLKELTQIVIKYEHRQWNMILPEHKNKKACGIWLSTSRTLEIWDILKGKRKKKYNDRRILKHVLCIVFFTSNRAKTTFKWPLTADEKRLIESEVHSILREHKIAASMATEKVCLTRPCVTPELLVGAEGKFRICFECALPLEEQKMLCNFCKQVSFCSIDCMEMNIDNNFESHPCSEMLRVKYFPSPTVSQNNSQIQLS